MFVNVSIAAFAKHKKEVLYNWQITIVREGASLFAPPLSGYFND
jgi:hypothetical protein